MAESEEYLLTYGTLRRGVHNPMQEFLSNSAQWIGKAFFQGTLYYANGHPAAVSSSEQEDQIVGDLFQFDTGSDLLNELDRYEGYRPEKPSESLYVRKKRRVTLKESGEVREAWIYIFNQPVERAELIASGDYVQYQSR
jgi:gamma-glutamylcyclotransferase (GGCT)/AIG2-like uncharacterized protein YtfP